MDDRPGAVLRPVGPLPARVYWGRRLVLLAVLAVVVLLVRGCLGGGDGGVADLAVPRISPSGAAPTAAAVPTPSPTSVDSRSALAVAPSAPVAPSVPPPSPTPAAPVACAPSALRLRTTTPAADQVAAAAPLRIVGTLSSTAATPCTVDIGPAAVLAVLTSGTDRIWASQDCRSEGSQVVTVAADRPVAVAVSFDGRRSRPGCPGGGDPTRVGTYRLSLAVGAVRAPVRVLRFR